MAVVAIRMRDEFIPTGAKTLRAVRLSYLDFEWEEQPDEVEWRRWELRLILYGRACEMRWRTFGPWS